MLRRLIFMILVFSQPADASIVPSHVQVPQVETRQAGAMSKSDFDRIIDRLERLYRNRVYQLGGDLVVNRLWANDSANATSAQDRGRWIINLYGGMARHPLITADGFALVACHEMGHHLAGFPQVSSWAASEGNSDYFATHACLKNLWKDDDDNGQAAAETLPERPKQLCEGTYALADGGDLALCYRSMAAAYSLASFLASLEQTSIDWNTPDPKVVTKTDLGYPSPQCRFDTLIEAALCQRPFKDAIIPYNERELAAGSCHPINRDTRGLRPRCWFQPRLSARS